MYETVRGAHTFSGSKPVYIAVGIYPIGALFNHECYPGVTRSLLYNIRHLIVYHSSNKNPKDLKQISY